MLGPQTWLIRAVEWFWQRPITRHLTGLAFHGKPDERLIIGRFWSQSARASETENRNAGVHRKRLLKGDGMKRERKREREKQLGPPLITIEDRFITLCSRQCIDLFARKFFDSYAASKTPRSFNFSRSFPAESLNFPCGVCSPLRTQYLLTCLVWEVKKLFQIVPKFFENLILLVVKFNKFTIRKKFN